MLKAKVTKRGQMSNIVSVKQFKKLISKFDQASQKDKARECICFAQ